MGALENVLGRADEEWSRIRREYEAAKAQFLAEARHEAKLIAKRKIHRRVFASGARAFYGPCLYMSVFFKQEPLRG
jgi:hypothetical protein